MPSGGPPLPPGPPGAPGPQKHLSRSLRRLDNHKTDLAAGTSRWLTAARTPPPVTDRAGRRHATGEDSRHPLRPRPMHGPGVHLPENSLALTGSAFMLISIINRGCFMAFRSRRVRQPVAAPLRRPRRPPWRGRRRPSPCPREHNRVNEIADTDSDGHAITETTGSAWAEPAHDAAGNMTTMPQPEDLDSSFTAVYDAWNRLTALKDGADVVAEYQYDGLHRRIVQHVDTTGDGAADLTRHDYYSRDWQLLEQREGTTPETADPERQYVWGLRYIDDLVLRDRDADGDGSFTVADERLYALEDGRFNVTALADHSGAVVERFAYTPYGEATVLDADFTVDADGTDHDWRIRYAGYRHDAESGLYHVRFRLLHAQLGRWVQRDPLGYVDGMNAYAGYHSMHGRLDPNGTDTYIQNRPLNRKNEDCLPPVEWPISHTFVFTTRHIRGIEVLDHTYSWGNEDDDNLLNLWFKDAPEDVSAANTALRQRDAWNNAPWYAKPYLPDNWGERVGGHFLDLEIEDQYQQRKSDPYHSSRHKNWLFWDSCKTEARDLIWDAQRAQSDKMQELIDDHFTRDRFKCIR